MDPAPRGPEPLDPEPDLLVVGGGPVGLVALLAALDRGLRVQGVERRAGPRPTEASMSGGGDASARHSRAIGIHPPALALLDRLGVAHALAAQGLRVIGGEARNGPGPDRTALLGRLSFREVLPPPWDHMLTLPQPCTEAVLEAAVRTRAPTALALGVEVVGLGEGMQGLGEEMPGIDGAPPGPGGSDALAREAGAATAGAVFPGPLRRADHRIPVRLADGRTIHPRFVLACDGRESAMRELRRIPVNGRGYPHRYLMGDFPDPGLADATEAEALLYLAPGGLVEGLPLPGGIRRWVVQRDAGTGTAPSVPELVETVARRTGVRLDPATSRMHSAFGVERRHAEVAWDGPVILAGDAAHIVSPIGGQGMNLGWILAAEAVERVAQVLEGGGLVDLGGLEPVAERYNRWSKRMARAVARRAEQNMALGHRPPLGPVGAASRNALVRLLLATPARRCLARRFTMQGLPARPPSVPPASGVPENPRP